jgi:uncharacterized protein YbjQ (UPF0145 family)
MGDMVSCSSCSTTFNDSEFNSCPTCASRQVTDVVAADDESALALAKDRDTSSEVLSQLAISTKDPQVALALMLNPSTPDRGRRRLQNMATPEMTHAFRQAGVPENWALVEGIGVPNAISPNKVLLATSPELADHDIVRTIGLVYSARSHTKWKANTQRDRLLIALDGAMARLRESSAEVGANAVVSVAIAANSSEGGSAVFGGSSDAIILLGTAVWVRKRTAPAVRRPCPICKEDIISDALKCRFCGHDATGGA